MKGVFSKPSGKYNVVPNLCFLSWRLQILAPCLFFNFLWLCKVLETLGNIYTRHFTMVLPLNFWWITKTPKSDQCSEDFSAKKRDFFCQNWCPYMICGFSILIYRSLRFIKISEYVSTDLELSFVISCNRKNKKIDI